MEQQKQDSRAYNRLLAGSSYYGCGRYLKWIKEIERQEVYSYFEFERLESKYHDIMEYYRTEAGENWNQTIFGYFFKYLGDPRNKHAYMSLAKRIGYNSILRERSNPMRVEALLLGASGLLKDYGDDLYTLTIKREAEYLMRKYDITPLNASDWNLGRVHPKNNPVLRLAQAATLFTRNDLLLDKILACRCPADIEEIFLVEASEYWTTHYVPSRVSVNEVKRLGYDKCNILGINLVVMLQFAYGSYLSNDLLIDQAQNLIQDLKPEKNYIVDGWRKFGLRPKTAFEGQALIQIGAEYCARSRCKECYLGARAVKNLAWLEFKE
ncbi:MAG: DUF2851 family protein [Rikenellaceae bacterium]